MAGPIVLIADGHEDSRIIYSACLRHRQYVTIEAGDGEEALRAARDYTPDLIILSDFLPRMDGLTVLRDLKAHAVTKHIPVLMTSFATYTDVRQRALAEGASLFILKPCAPRTMLDYVRGFVGARPESIQLS